MAALRASEARRASSARLDLLTDESRKSTQPGATALRDVLWRWAAPSSEMVIPPSVLVASRPSVRQKGWIPASSPAQRAAGGVHLGSTGAGSVDLGLLRAIATRQCQGSPVRAILHRDSQIEVRGWGCR